MKSPNPQNVRVVKKADKEGMLHAFVAEYLKGLDGADGVATSDRQITCIFRSANSPVTKVLRALKMEMVAANVSIHAIVAQMDAEEDDAGSFDFVDALRWAQNPRLIDAHEQLTLGSRSAWVGDSMRRDPELRDAYERYEVECVATSDQARQAFTRIWVVSEPVFAPTHNSEVAEIAGPDLMDPNTFDALPDEPTDRSNAATRH